MLRVLEREHRSTSERRSTKEEFLHIRVLKPYFNCVDAVMILSERF